MEVEKQTLHDELERVRAEKVLLAQQLDAKNASLSVCQVRVCSPTQVNLSRDLGVAGARGRILILSCGVAYTGLSCASMICGLPLGMSGQSCGTN
jgi:hypothetical protein